MSARHIEAAHAVHRVSDAIARVDLGRDLTAVGQVLRSMEPVLDRAFRPALELPLPDDVAALIDKLHAGPLGRTRRKPRRRAA